MKIKKILLFAAVSLTVLVAATLPNYTLTQDTAKEQLLMQLIVEGLNELHYEPQKTDDKFSERVYDLYLKRLDGGKRFLTQADVKKLEKYRKSLDEAIKDRDLAFLDLSISLFDKRKAQTQEFYREILAQPFDFTVEESIEVDPLKVEYPKNDAELKEFWRKSLKYQVLNRLSDLIKDQELADNGKSLEKMTYEKLEAQAREKVLKTHDDWFKRMEKINREDRLSAFLNSITAAHDPHTNYFPPQDKENFDISMSGRLEGIGARLQEDGKYVKVVSIVPGSPCWSQGELEVGDKIMAISQGEDEAVDASDMSIDDVVSMIRGQKGTEVRLTVRKRDNSTKIIPIIRDIVEMEEGYAKSAVLEKDGNKIGFIHLPKFYTDFQRNGGRRCAVDVKEELSKLINEGVKGVIIDLRDNGGGSLSDVVEMGGLFIDKGPIVQVKQRDKSARVLMDEEKGIHYNGKLIIMVNVFSASASEILAAALQDYGRAIIVGGSTTFGKGTVQQFVDLDRMVGANYKEMMPLGSVKLTTQKFYRINGGTTQLQGVTPDIIIPDDYTYLVVGEKEEDYALGLTEIQAAAYKAEPIANLDQLKKASAERIKKDAALMAIEANAKRLKTRRDETDVTLNLRKHQKQSAELDAEIKAIEQLEKEIKGLTITAPKPDAEAMEKNAEKKKRLEDWHKDLKKDAQLKETLAIMNDMLN